MATLEDLNTTWIEKEQRDDVYAARAALENATMTLDECHRKIQEIVDSGNFDTIKPDLKQTLNQWWTIIKTARASIGNNAEIMVAYEWRP